jgi:hypothetical protein
MFSEPNRLHPGERINCWYILDGLILLCTNAVLLALMSAYQAKHPIWMLLINTLDYVLFCPEKQPQDGPYWLQWLMKTSHGAIGLYASMTDCRRQLADNEQEKCILLEQRRQIRIRLYASLFIVWLRILAGGNKTALVYFHLY